MSRMSELHTALGLDDPDDDDVLPDCREPIYDYDREIQAMHQRQLDLDAELHHKYPNLDRFGWDMETEQHTNEWTGGKHG
jgi:hypothetical protein